MVIPIFFTPEYFPRGNNLPSSIETGENDFHKAESNYVV